MREGRIRQVVEALVVFVVAMVIISALLYFPTWQAKKYINQYKMAPREIFEDTVARTIGSVVHIKNETGVGKARVWPLPKILY